MKYLVAIFVLTCAIPAAAADVKCSSGKAGIYTFVKLELKPAASGKVTVAVTYRNTLDKATVRSRYNFKLIGKHQDWYLGMAGKSLAKPGVDTTDTQELDIDPKDVAEMQSLVPAIFCVEDTTDESGRQESYHR